MKVFQIAALALPLWTAVAHELSNYEWRHKCPQLRPIVPKIRKEIPGLDEYLSSEEFLQISVARLSGAVKIDTTSQTWWQDLPGKDPVWEPMSHFRNYLEKTFPLIHRHLDLERVNTHGLVYTWKGSKPSLKPYLFLAHQDVVPAPAETFSEWTHPPFSGFFDGKYVWGRGAIDCKTTLIASMSAVESLLSFGYAPQRTLVLAFGFDEEISGLQGAKRIAEHLAERYGNDGIALLVDEGPGIFHHKKFSTTYAVPGLSEKGIFNANISVHMESGHSSLSAGYNSITVMAALVGKINDNQLRGQIQAHDPFLQAVFCLGQHVPGLPKLWTNAIESVDKKEALINTLLPTVMHMMPALKPLADNTQALTMIQGGDKINVIPERTTLSINHRLHLGTSVEQMMAHLEQIVKDYVANISAAEGGPKLTLRGWSEEETVNSIKLTALPGTLEASPVTSFSVNGTVNGTTPYSVLQGTIRSVYDEGNLTLVAPISMPANTDSRHYWDLTQHIFRFNPGHDMTDATDNQIESNAHKINERANIVGHVNGVRWYSMFIRNMDEAKLA
ncbi:putative carboxypeptidase s [Diaporthe ampelina]|uniref:Putative carboxypeptidase s n=1 Tax=Diaporthe ampelina TaxID=1214573 RepID=A0A0G2FCA1_9PEZI|nr:putative carboxypeptidase s [Diaporthe ampelina]